MSHKSYFRQTGLQLKQESERKLSELRQDETMIDTLPVDQLRTWLRFLINENFRLSEDNKRLVEMIPSNKKL